MQTREDSVWMPRKGKKIKQRKPTIFLKWFPNSVLLFWMKETVFSTQFKFKCKRLIQEADQRFINFVTWFWMCLCIGIRLGGIRIQKIMRFLPWRHNLSHRQILFCHEYLLFPLFIIFECHISHLLVFATRTIASVCRHFCWCLISWERERENGLNQFLCRWEKGLKQFLCS